MLIYVTISFVVYSPINMQKHNNSEQAAEVEIKYAYFPDCIHERSTGKQLPPLSAFIRVMERKTVKVTNAF